MVDWISDLATLSGSEALMGVFRAEASEVRAGILSYYRHREMPDGMLKVALESGDKQVMWALAERHDLPASALDKVLEFREFPHIARTLASNPALSLDQLLLLLPGDYLVRAKIFEHPAATMFLRQRLLSTKEPNGRFLSEGTLSGEVSKREYALWLLEYGAQQGRLAALRWIDGMPEVYQWDALKLVAAGAVPLRAAAEVPGWSESLRRVLAGAMDVYHMEGSGVARESLGADLDALGRPQVSAVDEACWLPAREMSEVLEVGVGLPWGDLELLAQKGMVTTAAVRALLSREDCTVAFRSAALLSHGDLVDVRRMCSLQELRVAFAVSGFSLHGRNRMMQIFLGEPERRFDIVDLFGGFVAAEVVEFLQGVKDAAVRCAQLERLAAEFDARVHGGSGWGGLVAAVMEKPRATLGELLG